MPPPAFADLIGLKDALRRRMRRLRRRLAQADPGAAERAALALDLAAMAPVSVVSGYHPIGAEIDPAPLLARCAAAGARIAMPVGLAATAPLVFRAFHSSQAEDRDIFGARCPPAEAPALIPDLVIVPVLAFDARGGRLGQGAGAFDRTLAGLRKGGPMFALGLAYAGQEVADVPLDRRDARLDGILTEAGFRRFGARAR